MTQDIKPELPPLPEPIAWARAIQPRFGGGYYVTTRPIEDGLPYEPLCTCASKDAAVAAAVAAERENYTALLHAYHRACVDAANRANEIERLQAVWEDTRTQRDELLAHIARQAPLPQWAEDWLSAEPTDAIRATAPKD